jgi:LysM repeat protein
MDTISQESNGSSSYLPVAALIVGLIAGVLAGVALAKVSAANQRLEQQAAVSSRVNELETQVRQAVTTSEQASQRISKVASDTNNAFNQVGEVLNQMRGELAKAQETRQAPPPAAKAADTKTGGSSGAAPTAGPGEYVVKSGDTGTRIASNTGVSLQALMAANPDVNWNRLHVGQRIRLPAR